MKNTFLTVSILATSFVCLISFSNQVDAGVFSNSISKVISRKASMRQATGTVTNLTREEIAAMQRQLITLDRKSLARIEARYGEYIPATKLRESARCSTCFLDRNAYDAHLRRAYPNFTAADRKAILGDVKNGKIYVNSDRRQIQSTVSHERLHHLSHEGFRARAGSRLDEGFTEHFSRKIYSDLSLKGAPVVYQQEQRLVQMIHARTGEGPMAKAYFSGDIAPLRQSLDKQLGRGAFQKIAREADRGDFKAAERILTKGL